MLYFAYGLSRLRRTKHSFPPTSQGQSVRCGAKAKDRKLKKKENSNAALARPVTCSSRQLSYNPSGGDKKVVTPFRPRFPPSAPPWPGFRIAYGRRWSSPRPPPSLCLGLRLPTPAVLLACLLPLFCDGDPLTNVCLECTSGGGDAIVTAFLGAAGLDRSRLRLVPAHGVGVAPGAARSVFVCTTLWPSGLRARVWWPVA